MMGVCMEPLVQRGNESVIFLSTLIFECPANTYIIMHIAMFDIPD